ncbi:beta-1,4-N-acetylgalactosaminyltransferase 3-like [Brachionichthys hirsutus]|uniref:beta-1,4-N-acetylgalactosaminyltransferase 3-like n=1 Tax=Brachionichthys hirsutus TaxID=412623 RepID=UPI003604DF8B
MMSLLFLSKKLRRNTRYLLLLVILLAGLAVYHEMVAVNRIWTGANIFSGMNLEVPSWKRAMFENGVREDHQLDSLEDSASLSSNFTPQTWKPEFGGKANLHIFEDWCGSSVGDLFRNIHYPLYPHSRTTVQKLAVSPQWTNYGLRIFGYLHPYSDGEFVFALSSDDNSEFWLSTDESPFNVQLLTWVGKSGVEFTAPGEFDKFASQTSRPVVLSAQTKYYFEVIHKQNDGGTDHVEVAWLLLDQDQKFTVIESKYISLYVNEAGLLLGDVTHIPQTAATNQRPLKDERSSKADMLRKDPRDTLYRMPLLNNSFLHGVLPKCSYKPSYIIKGRTVPRYHGLNYIHLSYVYPNDYTRLTHMETQESCFYRINPNHNTNGFSQYMTLNHPDEENGRDNSVSRVKRNAEENVDGEQSDMEGEENQAIEEPERKSGVTMGEGTPVLELEQSVDYKVEEDHSLPEVFDTEVNWSQTFQVSQLDFHANREDKIELGCSISGNLLCNSNDIQSVITVFMDQLNQKHKGQLTLMRVINVVKRVDKDHGSRLLLELEVKDGDDQLFRLSHYVYHLTDRSGPQLCNPVDFHWNPGVTVHVLVPVKNQARWVQQLIDDMERVFKDTQDVNLNLIIADFSSTDMDVKKALKESTLPSYQYIKLGGNFQRSAGLQAGVNSIKDGHSIVFLCDLHIHFPSSIIDTIRKHCVEGYMAFAPIVMRLNCGATPLDARGWWEVNGFGLLGIYKSDLEAVGGMNTREYKAGWGGEDWELLDRILQAGLEVDRIYLRNFFHYYHSKRGMWNHGLSQRAS